MEARSQLVGIGLAELALLTARGTGTDRDTGRRRTDDAGQSEDLPHTHHPVLYDTHAHIDLAR